MSTDPATVFSLDRRAVAQAFDRASASYDAAAALQVRVRDELLERLAELKAAPLRILDLGAGTGHASRALKRRYPKSLVIAADIAAGMLARAKSQSRWLRRFERVRADAYSLPFRDGCFDLVFSSLMLQWCDDLDAVFSEAARVLKPGGMLLFSTFGPGTLAELREAWGASDAPGNHVNHFFDPHALGSALMHAGLSEPVLDVDRVVIDYPDVLTLMRELKAIGAHNVTRGRARGLTGRKRLAAMTRAYETKRRGGQLPATYEVIHAICWGAERRAQGFPGEALISPGSIRRRGQT
ncbi:MAG TPA: malonyl-ACP O-methyltransferase BioC [Steroidobacteraceae bacterium]|jgi:malonyl-CoA O-methyltransferase|nr:malonyl-ACP O-methyltransferase BioC [Steroidobacteraceae bacterium]